MYYLFHNNNYYTSDSKHVIVKMNKNQIKCDSRFTTNKKKSSHKDGVDLATM